MTTVLRNLFHRANLLAGEVRTLRGVIRALARSRQKPHRSRGEEGPEAGEGG